MICCTQSPPDLIHAAGEYIHKINMAFGWCCICMSFLGGCWTILTQPVSCQKVYHDTHKYLLLMPLPSHYEHLEGVMRTTIYDTLFKTKLDLQTYACHQAENVLSVVYLIFTLMSVACLEVFLSNPTNHQIKIVKVPAFEHKGSIMGPLLFNVFINDIFCSVMTLWH